MSLFQTGQPCFSISCRHLSPKTVFRMSGSLTPICYNSNAWRRVAISANYYAGGEESEWDAFSTRL
jgi:hypothetical protein